MTIKDIARESGYSVGTVSRVLNNAPGISEKARKKITGVVKKHNFQVNRNARHLKMQARGGIAVIIKGANNMLFASIMEPLQRLIEEKNFLSLVYYIGEEEDEVEHAWRICQERNPYGILFLGSERGHFRKGFSRIHVPCVLLTNSARDFGFDNLSSVSTDDEEAADFAVSHLIALGHKKIGVLGGIVEYSHAARARYRGVEKAFQKAGIPFDRERQYESAHFDTAEGYIAMKKLLRKMPDITALFAMSDVMAIGAIRAVRDEGLNVPEDISVIGFDGLTISSYLSPRLTTIHQDSRGIAERCVEILLANIDQKHTPMHEITPFYLVPGESVKRREETMQ